jgi:phosphopantetheinyl transferase
MYIFYTDGFEKGWKESRRLLKLSFERYAGVLGIEGMSGDDMILALKTGGMGKPEGGPFNFNISHSDNYWAVLIADGVCGFDIQTVKDADYERIADKVYNGSEAAAVRNEGADTFFRIWCRREALIKACGGSVFNETPELLTQDEDGFIRTEYRDRMWRVSDVEMPFDALAAYAVPEEEPLELKVIKL